ncbi:MAG TPA: lytic transglycosylase domain-containing protein [Longimicrobium sp.]|nr:lytic transglycosylase domain-containing protein [Longimicrobium sp.]
MKNSNDKAPRINRMRRLRNDTRSLLRSRPLIGLLAGVAGMQVVAVHHGSIDARQRDTVALKPRTLNEAMVQSLAPVTVQPLQDVRSLKMAAAAAPKATTAVKKTASKAERAEALAETYRKKGFSVPPSLARQILEAAEEYDIDPKVAFGLVKTESGFKNSATSHVGAMGLTQLMPATARWLEPGVSRSQLRDSRTNLRIGFRYLKDLIEKYDGDTELALLAYNRGPGTVDRVLRRGGDPDNGYADMVMGRRNSHR